MVKVRTESPVAVQLRCLGKVNENTGGFGSVAVRLFNRNIQSSY